MKPSSIFIFVLLLVSSIIALITSEFNLCIMAGLLGIAMAIADKGEEE